MIRSAHGLQRTRQRKGCRCFPPDAAGPGSATTPAPRIRMNATVLSDPGTLFRLAHGLLIEAPRLSM
jgi:hypothetical protein